MSHLVFQFRHKIFVAEIGMLYECLVYFVHRDSSRKNTDLVALDDALLPVSNSFTVRVKPATTAPSGVTTLPVICPVWANAGT